MDLDKLRIPLLKSPKIINQTRLGLWKPTRILILLLVNLLAGSLNVNAAGMDLMLHDLPDDELSLSLSGSRGRQQSSVVPQVDHSVIINKILNDDYSGEFDLTAKAIELVTNSLEQFAFKEQLNSDHLPNGQVISNWLMSHNTRADKNPLLKRMSEELDYIYGNFWTQFKRLIQEIIEHRPTNLGFKDLAFRCEKYNELKDLRQLVSNSPLYSLIMDTFSTELYTHCLMRKLAMIKIHHVQPSSVVRQFVDIYLGFPPELKGATNEFRQLALKQWQVNLGVKFNLEQSLALHGPLESVVGLVLDAPSGLSIGSKADTRLTIQRFKQDCLRHINELTQLWASFDDMAAFLSSPTNDLSSFNGAVKLAAPQLVYGAICGQLAQTSVI